MSDEETADVPESEIVESEIVKSAGDMRTESIAHALDAAYAKASSLVLTKEESDALAADFTDEAFRLGAAGNMDLIYIEHAYLRQRLNSVLGLGAATPVRRTWWKVESTYVDKYKKTQTVVKVYVDLVLIVRGCFVSEAIGDADYYPGAGGNLSDGLESAKSAAFRRCCKEFGVGLQAWMKGWGEGWKQRNRSGTPQPRPAAAKPAAKPLAKAPKATSVTMPNDWPNTRSEDLVVFANGLLSTGEIAAALKELTAEQALISSVPDWEGVLAAIVSTYKMLTKDMAKNRDAELERAIKAEIDALDLLRHVDQSLETHEANA